MKFQTRFAFAVLVALLAFSAVLPMHAQKTMPRYVPPQTQRYIPPPVPRTVPRSTPVQSLPVTQHQTNTVPQHQTNPAPQHQAPVTPQRPAPARPAPPTSGRSQTPSSANQPVSRSQPTPPRQDRAQQQRQQKEDARQQNERAKQEQKAQKEHARRQKEEAKQQEKQKKEQARQEKVRNKEKQKAQKEEARKNKNKGAKPADKAAAKAATESPREPQSHSGSISAYRTPDPSSISGKTAGGSMTLTHSGSESVMHQVNSARANMTGTNRKPLPAGDVTVHRNGRLTLNAPGGREYGVRRDGTVASYRDSTKSISFDRNGKVSALRSSNLEVRHGSHGERSIISHGSNNTTLVSTGRHSGYMERNLAVGNRTYIQRTTVINQRIVSRNYIVFTYGGVGMARFVTPVFFAPGFYGWTFYPWAVPIHFSFGWLGAPWYVGPDPYFAVYPEYPGAAYWLTDYAIGDTLSDAYQLDADAELDDNADNSVAVVSRNEDEAGQTDRLTAETATPISAEIKASIVEQVKQELSYDSAASSAHAEETGYDEVSSVLNRPNQFFIVSSNLDVSTVDEQVCGLEPGDILQLTPSPASNSQVVQLRVASSKRRDCPTGVMVTVSMADLQEMRNNFRARVEAGLGKLQAGQGHDGIPVAPGGVDAPPRPNIAAETEISASEMNSALAAQRQQADVAESEIVEGAFSQGQ
jgi:flagellar biosynthesis GTPase FlhF